MEYFERAARAVNERSARDLGKIAAHHGGMTDEAGCGIGGLGDRLGQHPLDSSLPELAGQQTNEKVLLAGRRALKQIAEQIVSALSRSRGRSSARCESNDFVDITNLERGILELRGSSELSRWLTSRGRCVPEAGSR